MAKARLTEIDGLRGVAALAVMFGHWGEFVNTQGSPAGWTEALQHGFLDYFSFGRLGIVAFFCISGFVVPFSFRGQRPLIAFPLSRIFRLYPAYWASIAVAVLTFYLLGVLTLTPTQIMINLTMVQLGLGIPPLLGVYWTLTIELVFYGICYLMFAGKILYSGRANFIAMSAFLALSVAIGAYRWIHPESNLPVGLPTYLAAMHFGTMARLRYMEGGVTPRFYHQALALLVVLVLTANTLAYLRAHNEPVGWIASNLGYLVGLALFLLCVQRKWFGGPTFAFLGLISYSMYLFHPVLIELAEAFWPAGLGWFGALAVLTPLYFGLSMVVASLVQRFIERPGVLIGRKVENAIDAVLDHAVRPKARTS